MLAYVASRAVITSVCRSLTCELDLKSGASAFRGKGLYAELPRAALWTFVEGGASATAPHARGSRRRCGHFTRRIPGRL